MKYRPEYPTQPFESLAHAQMWVDDFVCWYNTVHLHSSILFVTPDDRHYGREYHILANRQSVYEQARQHHPSRWARNTRNWNPVYLVELNPEKEPSTGTSPLKEAA